MHAPPELYPMELALAERLPHPRPAQRRGLALWVLGTVLARSACQSAVLAALLMHGRYHALRQRLREWLHDGRDKAAPCATQLEVEPCFAPLLGWVLRWWQGRELAPAIDATARGERVVALVVSVLYRGSAIPVAWAILPGNEPGPWLKPILRLLRCLRPAVPPGWTVLVLADRGLWSPRLWKRVRDLGWHPLLRIQNRTTIAPDGRERCAAKDLVRPGQAWVGRGRLGTPKRRRLAVTLIARCGRPIGRRRGRSSRTCRPARSAPRAGCAGVPAAGRRARPSPGACRAPAPTSSPPPARASAARPGSG